MRLRPLFLLLLLACNGNPTEPHALAIASGKWSGDGACLNVPGDSSSSRIATLIAGCRHGTFPIPEIRSDGTFDVDGTYRIEAGPVSPNPPPPAHYSGSLTSTTLTLKVTPSDPAIQPATFRMHVDPNATCAPPCV